MSSLLLSHYPLADAPSQYETEASLLSKLVVASLSCRRTTPTKPIVVRDPLPHAQAAADRASRVFPDWQERACEAFLKALDILARPALCEEVVHQIEECWWRYSLPEPPEPRAWGAVTTVLSRQGKIVASGVKRDHRRSFKTTWRAA